MEELEVVREPVRVVQKMSEETRATAVKFGIKQVQGHYVIRDAAGNVKDEFTIVEEL
jgi:hypothetical protein